MPPPSGTTTNFSPSDVVFRTLKIRSWYSTSFPHALPGKDGDCTKSSSSNSGLGFFLLTGLLPPAAGGRAPLMAGGGFTSDGNIRIEMDRSA